MEMQKTSNRPNHSGKVQSCGNYTNYKKPIVIKMVYTGIRIDMQINGTEESSETSTHADAIK